MYSVSNDFQTEIIASPRTVYGKVQIDYTDPFLDQSIVTTSNDEANVSYIDQTSNGILKVYAKFAALDGSWILGNGYALTPSYDDARYEVGWISGQLSGVDGAFSVPYPKLTCTFSSRPVSKLLVAGDDKRLDFPVDFTVKLYGAGDVLKHTETVTANDLVLWEENITPVTEVVKAVLEITKVSAVNRSARIIEFFTSVQEIYEGEDIIEINLLEEREISNGGLPVGNISSNELDIKLSNVNRFFDADNTISPLYQVVKPNRRIKAWLGVMVDAVIEYVPLGIFWSGDWEVPEDGLYARTIARDRLELLSKSIYRTSTVSIDSTLLDLAVEVLTDAGLTNTEYSIDTELDSYVVPYGYFDSISHRECLRLITEACNGQCYCDRDGIIKIEGPSYLSGITTSDLIILKENYFKKNTPSITTSIANYIEVETQPLVKGTEIEIYRSIETVAVGAGLSVTVNIKYNNVPSIDVSSTLEGATNTSITAETYYAYGADITLTNSGGTTEDITIVTSGKPLTTSDKNKIVATDATSVAEYGTVKYTLPVNAFMQNNTIAQNIADTILAAYKDALRDLTLEWRGNPALLLGNRITLSLDDPIYFNDYTIVGAHNGYEQEGGGFLYTISVAAWNCNTSGYPPAGTEPPPMYNSYVTIYNAGTPISGLIDLKIAYVWIESLYFSIEALLDGNAMDSVVDGVSTFRISNIPFNSTDYYVVRQELNYDGTLKSTLNGRRA
jgi:hypothetical protein